MADVAAHGGHGREAVLNISLLQVVGETQSDCEVAFVISGSGRLVSVFQLSACQVRPRAEAHAGGEA